MLYYKYLEYSIIILITVKVKYGRIPCQNDRQTIYGTWQTHIFAKL